MSKFFYLDQLVQINAIPLYPKFLALLYPPCIFFYSILQALDFCLGLELLVLLGLHGLVEILVHVVVRVFPFNLAPRFSQIPLVAQVPLNVLPVTFK